MKTKKILVTGAAGFIGYHVCNKLLRQNIEVVGIDNLNSYYDVRLKLARANRLMHRNNFTFYKMSITDKEALNQLFERYSFDIVINLAAQAGVRYSIENPYSYVENNITGFLNILECSKSAKIEKLIFASSSSVYGENKKIPFSENDFVDNPVSVYAATKKSNELFAHVYSSLYKIPTIGLRFFTVYGEWGRPDMAYYIFTKRISEGLPINLFNNGLMRRDFTYVDDIVEGISSLTRTKIFNGETAVPYKIFNIGNNKPVELKTFVEILENALGKKANINYLPMQAGDVTETYADIERLSEVTGFKPSTPLEKGLGRFVNWYSQYTTVPEFQERKKKTAIL